MKKHATFESDLSAHSDNIGRITGAGHTLAKGGNHHNKDIHKRCEQLQEKIKKISGLAAERKRRLDENCAMLQFMWKADVVEAWISAKEPAVKSNDFGKDLSSVRMLLTKQV